MNWTKTYSGAEPRRVNKWLAGETRDARLRQSPNDLAVAHFSRWREILAGKRKHVFRASSNSCRMTRTRFTAVAAILTLMLIAAPAGANPEADQRAVAELDTAYQAAVERNDADAMAAIMHEDMILVLGDGSVHTRDDVLNWARQRLIEYEVQDEEPGTQTVRMYGPDTAVVTALLVARGTRANGTRVDVRLWFTDTYVRTPEGWRYAFGQASTALPNEQSNEQSNEQ